MSDLQTYASPTALLTMSSLEISELVGSRHADVIRSVERLMKRGVVAQTPMATLEKINGLGYEQRINVYNLNRRDSTIAVAQLSPEFTAKLVDRWQELETQATSTIQQLPMSPATLALAEAKLDQREAEVKAEATAAAKAAKVAIAEIGLEREQLREPPLPALTSPVPETPRLQAVPTPPQSTFPKDYAPPEAVTQDSMEKLMPTQAETDNPMETREDMERYCKENNIHYKN